MFSKGKLFARKLVVAIAVMEIFAGCGSNSQHAVMTQPQPNQFGSALFKLAAASNSPFERIAKTITLTISASDMNTLTKSLTKTDSIVTGTITGIPVGENRLFRVDVYDSLDTDQYTGSTMANVTANDTVPVQIVVSRISGSATVNATVNEGSNSLEKIVFLSDRGGTQQLWKINTDGTGLAQLTNGGPSTKFWPKWSPDGSKIVYCGCACDAGQGFGAQIFILDTNGNLLDTVKTAASLVGVAGLGWSNDGGSILYSENISCGQRMRKVSITTGTDSILYNESGTTQNQPDDNPTGNGKILYVSAPCAGYSNIEMFNENTKQSVVLTSYTILCTNGPRWSKDGQRIVFWEDSSVTNYGNSLKIGLMNADGTNQIIINTCHGEQPMFAEGTSQIVFSRPENDDVTTGKYNIWIMGSDGSNLNQLTTGNFVETNPDVH